MYHAIPNLASSVVSLVEEPWTRTESGAGLAKVQFNTRNMQATTQSCFICGYEGVSQLVRVSEKNDNPPHALHQIIVDYDSPLPDDPVAYLKDKMACEFLPSWVIRTHSGHGRLVWPLQRPLMVAGDKHARQLQILLRKKLGLVKWMAGFDEKFGTPAQYYHVGREWIPVPDAKPIPASHMELWAFEASRKATLWDDPADANYEVPLEAVREAIAAQYPGRWNSPVEIGARGVRFWDPIADNETAAVITEKGMLCFTGPQAFVPWRQIFGAAFVEKFEADKITALMDRACTDGTKYFIYNEDEDRWDDWSKDDMKIRLRGLGFSSQVPKGETQSPVDLAIIQLQHRRRVSRALPFLYMPMGIIKYRGETYLNDIRVAVMPPAPPFVEGPMTFGDGKRYFPFIYQFLKTMFGEPIVTSLPDGKSVIQALYDIPEGPGGGPQGTQLETILAWLQYFYVNSLKGLPRAGHGVVLAGAVGLGKSLFAHGLVGGLMGGSEDGSGPLVEGDQWTGRLARSPVVLLDDIIPPGDHRKAVQFTARLRRLIANSQFVYNDKYAKTGTVPWFGRPIMCCNDDPESLRSIPSMDLSIRDKLMLFRCSEHKVKFPPREEIEKILKAELPYLARFLIDWATPEHLLAAESRFGIRTYHHPYLLNQSIESGHLGQILELVALALKPYFHEDSARLSTPPEYWTGTATELYGLVCAVSGAAARDISARSFATALGNLQRNGYALEKVKQAGTNWNVWQVRRDLYQRGALLREMSALTRKDEGEEKVEGAVEPVAHEGGEGI